MLAEAGLPDLTAMTSTEIATVTSEQFGDGPARDTAALGGAANAATYRPSAAVAMAEADTAWQQHSAVRKQVHRQLGLRGRLAAGLRYQRHGRVVDPVSPQFWDSAERAERSEDPPRRPRGYEGRRRH
jgi:hypothetical protein